MIRALLKTCGCLGCFGLLCSCIPLPSDVYVGDEPPPTYVATTTPVYYEGRPVYWYGGSWYYRDGDHWDHYHQEPAYLQNYRVQHVAPVRTYYGHRGGGERWGGERGGERGGEHGHR